MRKTKAQKLAEIHLEAVQEFDSIYSAVREEREQCLEDRRFYSIAGAQWEGSLSEQFDNKPKFEVNKIHLAVLRIINEYLNNRITVDYYSKDGSENDETADLMDGLYRACEQESSAEEAYDNAFEEGAAGGMGAWRYTTAYEDEEDEEDDKQRIMIEPIYDADSSVFFDLGAKRQDKRDATRCFVITSMTPQAYESEYGDSPQSWDKTITRSEFDWATNDVVYVAEYYVVEHKKEIIEVWEMLDGTEERIRQSELEEHIERLEAIGAKLARTKTVKVRKVHKYILSGGGILEDCGYIAGKSIPIVPYYGKRWFVDNIERCMGHVRLAKDAQRLKNMQLSRLGEIAALSPIEKPIFTAEQVSGHEYMWAEDNLKDYPYLLVNPITDANGSEIPGGPVAYTKPPSVPQAMAALLQLTEEDMNDLLGGSAQMDMPNPAISGVALDIQQNRLDMQSYIYMSNMAKAIKRGGEIFLEIAQDIYVEEGRKMKVVDKQGATDQVELMVPYVKNGEQIYKNDLSRAKLDVATTVGPTSSSKRAATVRALTSMIGLSDDPETKQVLAAMALMNMEGEGVDEIRDYFRQKLIKLGVIEPTQEEAEALMAAAQNQKPSAQDQYLQAAAQEAQAKAVKAQADTIYTQARADETRAKTAETLAEIDIKRGEQAMNVIEKFGPRVTPPSFPNAPVEEF